MIDTELRTFLEGGLGIHLASRTARLEPNGARAVAVKVEEDGLHLLVYVAEAAVKRVLPDLQGNGVAAVVFGRPVDDRACQIKGIYVDSRPAVAAEHALVVRQWHGYLDNLEKIGIPREGASNWIVWPAVVVRVRATAVFEQSPGPEAGAQLAPRR